MGIGAGIVTANKQRAGYEGRTLWQDMEMIDKLKWTNFITAHGSPVTDGRAHATCDASHRVPLACCAARFHG